MRFRLEKNEIDFGSTQIDNIFIEDFMPVARGAFVKVYLYAYKNMISESDTYELSNEKLAKNLNLNISDVEAAWDYWVGEGVVEKVYNIDGSYDIEFKNLKKYYISNVTTPKRKSKGEILVDSMKNSTIRQMYGEIDYFMRRQTTPTEKAEILSWISDFNMSPEIISTAFQYTTEKKNKISVAYVRAVISSWYDKGLFDMEDVEEEIEKSDKKFIRKNKILRKLGLKYRAVSEEEIRLINNWYDRYDFSDEIIDEALKRTAKIERPNIKYVDAILRNWKEKGIEELDEIEKLDKRPRRKNRRPRKTGFHNFTGQSSKYTPEELERIAREKTRKG